MLLIKKDGSKFNFIDNTDAFVGYDIEQSYYSLANWYLCSKKPKKISDLENFCIHSNNDVSDLTILNDFLFDRSFHSMFSLGSTNCAMFRLIKPGVKKQKKMYLVLTNTHNGYYSSFFDSYIDAELWKSGDI